MTSDANAWILDVGHGCSTVVEWQHYVSVIDGGRGRSLLEFLEQREIHRIDDILVSHADADHMNGVSMVLSDSRFSVRHIYLNPDKRDKRLWNDFASELKDAKQRGTDIRLELTDAHPHEMSQEGVRLEVLAPSQELAMMTANGHTLSGAPVSPNTMSAVVRVWAGDSPRLLLAGDIDRVGLDSLLESHSDVRADVLVFPHHGGHPGQSDARQFAELICSRVQANLVVFSIGRGQHGTPRPEIVSGVLRNSSRVHIACTQLSERCAEDVPQNPSPFQDSASSCASKGTCCAGTIRVSLDEDGTYSPSRNDHQEFIRQNAPSALCQERSDP